MSRFRRCAQARTFRGRRLRLGGRASYIAAALYPDYVRAAVLIGGYTIQDTLASPQPAAPEIERALWYQWYFNTERGRAGLAANRRSFWRLLWQLSSPTWHFSDETYNRTAASFDNPDFVDVVIHSFRHRNGNASGEVRFLPMERQLAGRPKIQSPVIILHGADDGIARPPADSPADHQAGGPPRSPGRRPLPAARKTGRRLVGASGAAGRTLK